MVHLLRKHQQKILLLVTIVVIVTFISFWNPSQRAGGGGSDAVARIYDHPVSFTDYRRNAHRFDLCFRYLGMREFVGALIGDAQSESDAQRNFIFNLMVLHHECDALGVEATDD